VDIVARGAGRLNAAELRLHVAAASRPERLVDLRRATFVDPGSLVTIAAVTERAVCEGLAVRFLAPEDGNCATYLARMRLGQHLARLGISHDLQPVRENPQGDNLSELRRFDSEEEYDELAGMVMRNFHAHHPEIAKALYRSVHEIASNVIEHSGQSGGYLALQRFGRSSDVAFAVADSGIGLSGSLRKRFDILDDRTAIVRAAQEHVSSRETPGRGLGIRRVIAITWAHAGSVLLASGSSQGLFARGHMDPQLHDLVAPLPGTLAQARLAVAHSVS
jgi:hypothetical protein